MVWGREVRIEMHVYLDQLSLAGLEKLLLDRFAVFALGEFVVVAFFYYAGFVCISKDRQI